MKCSTSKVSISSTKCIDPVTRGLFVQDQPWYKSAKTTSTDNDEVDLKRKHRLDPMTQVNELLKEKDKSKKRKKEEKHKKPRQDGEKKKAKTIEQLRAERLKRENEERAKAQRLILGIKDTDEPKVEADDRKRRYNNQFNPDMAKY